MRYGFTLKYLYIKPIEAAPTGVFLGKAVLKICSKFIGEHPCQTVISKNLQITLRHGCSPVNLLHIFRTPLLRTPLKGCFRIKEK